MKRLLPLALATTLAGCATTDGARADKKAPQKLSVANVIPFDVAACGARPLDLSALTPEVLFGALLSMDNAYQECFLDPKSLDGAEFKAALKATVGAAPAFEVTGTGLTPAGQACVVEAARKLPFKPLEAGAKPVAAEVPLAPSAKAVAFGVNVASDAVGTIRLAQPAFCPCYAELGTRPAPVLVAKLVVAKDKPVEVTMEPNDAPSVAACVLEKVKALPLPKGEFQVPYQFLLKNAYASEASPGALPALQFQQYEGMRAQRTADVLVAAGRHGVAGAAYDAVVTKYRATRAVPLIAELRTRCAAVLAADDAQKGALKALAGVLEASARLVQAEKAKDPAWAGVEQALTEQLAGTAAEVTRVDTQRKADEAACPKNR
jgi:predicted small secreted protein